MQKVLFKNIVPQYVLNLIDRVFFRNGSLISFEEWHVLHYGYTTSTDFSFAYVQKSLSVEQKKKKKQEHEFHFLFYNISLLAKTMKECAFDSISRYFTNYNRYYCILMGWLNTQNLLLFQIIKYDEN